MTVVRAGCSSWTSPAWNGRFYPEGLADGDRLAFYARYFDCVEVDATYYAAPNPFMVRAWARKTPDDFAFTLKMSRDLIDPKKKVDPAKLAAFGQAAAQLGPKLAAVLLQFPPWFKGPKEGSDGMFRYLEELFAALPPGARYAVELRDAAWFQGAARERLERLLRDRAMPLCWSSLNYVDVPPLRTADWAYLRFIGDHTTIPAEEHGEIRADKRPEIAHWARILGASEIESAFAFFNNHFAGYAPASVNLFRESLGMAPIRFRTEPQSKLSIG